MDKSRRSFLKKAGCTVLGLGGGFPLLGATAKAMDKGAATTSQLAMVVDVKKCLQADVYKACAQACHIAHNVPSIPGPGKPPDLEEEVKWIWKEEYNNVFPDQVHAHTAAAIGKMPVLVLCNHCSKPSCVRVCPTGATWKRKNDGVVMMDMHRCIGCRYCMAACPYGARSFNWRDPRQEDEKGRLLYFAKGELPASDYPARTKGVVEKCTFCAERLRVGRVPACVEALEGVPGAEGALTFGDLSDEHSEVSKVLHENHTICRRVALGTEPNVFYIV